MLYTIAMSNSQLARHALETRWLHLRGSVRRLQNFPERLLKFRSRMSIRTLQDPAARRVQLGHRESDGWIGSASSGSLTTRSAMEFMVVEGRQYALSSICMFSAKFKRTDMPL